MKKLIIKMVDIFFKKEFIIFLIVGVINTFNGTLFSFLFSMIMQANVAFACGFVTSLTINYILNSFITFKESLNFNKFIKFCISYIPNFLVQFLSVYIIYNRLGYDKIVAYIAAAVIGIPVTFILLKFYAFTKKK